jgi:hypothetical protein
MATSRSWIRSVGVKARTSHAVMASRRWLSTERAAAAVAACCSPNRWASFRAAAQLAACGYLAVFPVTGWWRQRADQEHWCKQARYALVVTIRTPVATVDLYTPDLSQIQMPTPVETEPECE